VSFAVVNMSHICYYGVRRVDDKRRSCPQPLPKKIR